MKNDFVHLHIHSTYSLLDSVATIPKLVRRAKELGMSALALTDHGNMFGIKEFYDACVSTRGEQAIKPILGCEVFVTSSGDHTKRDKNEKRQHLCLYAKNKTGFQNLMRLVSLAHREGFYFRPRIDRTLLERYHEGLACTSACIAGEVASCLDRGETAKAEEAARWYKNLFGEDYYLEVMLHPAFRRHPDIPKDAEIEHVDMFQRQQRVMNGLLALGQKLGIPCLASNDVHFVRPEDVDAQDVWLALGTGHKMIDPNRLVYMGSEWLKTGDEMAELFPDHPELLTNTLRFAERIETFSLDDVPLMPEFPIPESFGTLADYAKRFDETALKAEFNSVRPIEYERLGGYEKVLKIKLQSDYLREFTYAGAKKRWGNPIPKDVCDRLDFELDVIKRMGYPGYLLIVQDYVTAARRMGVAVGPGRGSAAGSAVVYALGITSVDPLEHDLLFERFLNPDRISCPDIDIDFDDEGRQKVIDYVAAKYGADRVARIITFGTECPRAAIKDVSRVLDYPLKDANRLAALVPNRPRISFEWVLCQSEELRRLYENGEPIERKILHLAEKLEGCVRQPGMHACGLIVSPDPLTDHIPLTAVDLDDRRSVTQYDGRHVETVGLVKFDFLGLAELTIQKNCLAKIREATGETIDLETIPFDDSATLELFGRGDTLGVFQFESAGMQKWLTTLKPTSFAQLAAMNALYRPGPMEWISRFIARCHGDEPIVCDHPLMAEYTKETYGLVVYQEQIMLLARLLAGFTRGQADKLRKAMAKKQMAIMDEFHPRFIDGCLANPAFRVGEFADEDKARRCAEKIWKNWSHFALYAFNKSHAVCYAKLAYHSAYLKAHHRAAFLCAMASKSIGRGAEALRSYIPGRDVQGITMFRPDINASGADFILENGGEAIRFALGAVKGVGIETAAAIVAEREANGPYASFCAFVTRMKMRESCSSVTRRIIENLVWAGAFDSLFKDGEDMSRERLASGLDPALKLAAVKQLEAEGVTLNGLGVDLSDSQLPAVAKADPVVIVCHEREVLGLLTFATAILGSIAYGLDGLVPDCEVYELENMQDSEGHVFHVGGVLERLNVGEKRSKGKPTRKTMHLTLDDGSGEIEMILPDEDQKFTWLGDHVGLPVLVGVSVANGERTVVSVDVPASLRKESDR